MSGTVNYNQQQVRGLLFAGALIISKIFSGGVSPKWVIMRFRLQEATALLAENKRADKTQIAFDLGYFDQAHF